MTRVAALGVLLLLGSTLAAQRPSDPALLIPETAPPLEYVPVANPVTLPEGTKMGATAAVAFDACVEEWGIAEYKRLDRLPRDLPRADVA